METSAANTAREARVLCRIKSADFITFKTELEWKVFINAEGKNTFYK